MEYYIFTTIPLLVASYFIISYLRHKFSNLPPTIFPTIPIIGHLYLLKKPLYRSFAAISKKHGPILFLRFGSRPVLLVSSPSISQECLTNNDIIFANRPLFLYGKIIGCDFTSIAWASYGNHWRNLRRISNMIFSSHGLNEFHDIRIDEGRRLIHKLVLVSAKSSSQVNLKTEFQEMTLNIVMRMIAGKRYYGGDIQEDGKQFQQIVKEKSVVGGLSNLQDYLPILNWLGMKGVEKKMIWVKNKRNAFFQGLIDELREAKAVETKENNKEKKNTMIEVLFKLQETDPKYYTDELIRSFVLNILSAGTDTSATTMEWAFSLMLNHPHVLKKAQNEIDSLVGKQRLLDESDMTSLPYLRCIVNETLRMYPPTPLLLPHESSEDCVVGSYHIPRGTMLVVNQWAIQHDPTIWSDPERFDPERFEGIEGTRDGFRFMPFGSGRRICPGDGLAMRMVMFTLGLLIQCFDWERLGEKMVDLSEGPGLTMPKAQPLLAICKQRPMMHDLLAMFKA